MRDERSGVNLSCFNKAKHLLAIASIHATRFEREVLAIHIGQRKHLRLVVEGYHGNDGIRTSTLPRQTEGVVGTSHFEYSIGSTMVAIPENKILTFFRSSEQYIGIMLAYKCLSFFRLLSYNDTFGLMKHSAEQSADSRRSRSYNQYGIVFGYF